MPPKGVTNNPNGRPKGSPNKVTAEIKVLIHNLLQDNAEQFVSDFKELEPADRVRTYLKLLEYEMPKLQRTIVDTQANKEDKFREFLDNLE